jgi:hypothetical protein
MGDIHLHDRSAVFVAIGIGATPHALAARIDLQMFLSGASDARRDDCTLGH